MEPYEGENGAIPEESAAGAVNKTSSNAANRNYTRKLSVSEEATLASSKRFKPPRLLKAVMEFPFRTKNPTHGEYVEEGTAWAMDAAGRGPLNQAGSYLGTAIISLATQAAGCDKPATCDNKVYGMKPSSLLTMASVIIGVACAVLMPIVGAIVDHTSHRKTVGVISAVVVCAATGFQISISLDTWFAVWILEIVGGFSLIMHFTSVMAYLPDLTEVEYELTHYTSRFNIVQYLVQMLYVAFLVGMSYGLKLNNVEVARVAVAGAFTIATIFFTYAWTFLFRKRPALRKVQEGDNLASSGFKQLYRTSKKIFKRYRALRWFMIALLWSPEAGAGVVLSIVVTFLIVTLGLKGIEVGIASLTMLLSTIPGSLFANWFMRKWNPLNSFRWAILYMAFTVGLTVGLLNSPERKYWTFGIAVLWGIAYGWAFPSQRTLQVTLTPRGQETEMMGLFAFCTQVIGWLPALIFSILNERGVDMRWGVSVVAFELLISLFFLFLVGDYETALLQVRKEATIEAAEAKDGDGAEPCEERPKDEDELQEASQA